MNMINTKHVLSVLLAIAMLFCMNIGTVNAFAASSGIYIATAAPHYRHPGTGNIEDSGGEGSETLGQSMTESATHTKALVEIDASGNTYVTVRLKLMDNIENPQFQVDGKRNGSFSSVSASLMQEDYTNNTADFRMKVPSEKAVIRCNMYVVPMGREVIFYITVSDLKSGSGDFITSIKEEKTTAKKSTTQKVTKAESATQSTTSAKATSKATTTTTTVASSTTTTAQSKPQSTTKADLQEFDAAGNQVAQNENTSDSEKSNSKAGWIVGGVIIVVLAGICIWYFCFYKKRK